MLHNETYSQYDKFMGRWSRQVATQFIKWIGAEQMSSWLDVGCGTGTLAETIIKNYSPSLVIGIDPLEKSIAAAKLHPDNKGIEFHIGDAQNLQFKEAKFDVVISGLMIKFVEDKVRAISEMKRVARPGSIVALYDWDMDGNMNTTRHFWDAVAAIIPGRIEGPKIQKTPMTEIGSIASLFKLAGIKAVKQRIISFTTQFQNLDDYWVPITNNSQNVGQFYKTMTEGEREAVYQRMVQTLPFNSDGSISFESRAVAIKGLT
jgi:ubiquinone/menaquinone biosynthesis C-methylase UbiE